VAEALADAIFAVWLAATLAAAVDDSFGKRRVRRGDVLGLIPAWSFFAPNPGIFDYHLLARSRRRDGSVEPFSEIAPPEVTPWRSIWHPEKRVRKTIFSCCEDLRRLDDAERAGVEYTLAYLTLLTLASSRVDPADTASVQFMLLRTGAQLEQPELLVRSRFHPVAG
jgi:hypothetical protein